MLCVQLRQRGVPRGLFANKATFTRPRYDLNVLGRAYMDLHSRMFYSTNYIGRLKKGTPNSVTFCVAAPGQLAPAHGWGWLYQKESPPPALGIGNFVKF